MSDFNQAIIKEFRANDGKVGGYFAGANMLLLHTVGAKSGQARTNPLVYVTDGDRLVVGATKSGADSNPDWYYNLLANPAVTVELGTEQFRARATALTKFSARSEAKRTMMRLPQQLKKRKRIFINARGAANGFVLKCAGTPKPISAKAALPIMRKSLGFRRNSFRFSSRKGIFARTLRLGPGLRREIRCFCRWLASREFWRWMPTC